MANRGRHRKKITPEKIFNLASSCSSILIESNDRTTLTYRKYNFNSYSDFKTYIRYLYNTYHERVIMIDKILIDNQSFKLSEII